MAFFNAIYWHGLAELVDARLKQRMVGAAVLVSLGIIIIPMLLDGSGRNKQAPAIPDMPAQPILPAPLPIDETPIALLGGTKIITDENESAEQVAAGANSGNLSAWVVQIGSFSKKTNAVQLMEKLKAGGFNAFVEPVNIATGVSHRVRIGPELTRGKAVEVRDQIAKEFSRDGVVMRYLGPSPN